MFKRSTKITSLLVVAASVASMVPAYAADYKKIETEDGTVYNAVAYKDGEFYIDGEVNDKDEATYYYKDGKYNTLNDIDTGSDVQAYGTKYAEVGTQYDGDYYLDLSTGKVTDDEIAQNDLDDAASALRRKVKKDDPSRYTETDIQNTLSTSEMETARDNVPSNKFGDAWYQTSYTATDGNKDNGGATSFTVYTDGSGNYIDADYNLGRVTVVTTGSSVSVKNTTDGYGTNNSIKVAVRHIKTLGQDANYIYRLASITVNQQDVGFGSRTNKVVPANTTGAAVVAGTAWTQQSPSYTVIQRISKAQASDSIDDAKYAKNVDTYFVTDDDGDSVADKLNVSGTLDINDDNCQFAISNGKIIAYEVNSAGDSVEARAITLKTDNGYNYTDVSDGDSQDLDAKSNKGTDSVDVDSNGTVYAVDAGYVYQFNNDDKFEKIYKVDGAFDRLSVYDQNDMVLWSSDTDDEVYSVIGAKNGSDDNTKTDTDTTNTKKVGWVQNTTDGSWSYYKEDGTQVKNSWIQSPTSGLWYFMNDNGVMMSNGWLPSGGKWYYLSDSGYMKTGWIQLSGTWYYLDPVSGGPLGAMKTGWFQDTTGTWYYANESGAMLHDTTVGGYVLGSNGAWIR